jgi:hypothetical protein
MPPVSWADSTIGTLAWASSAARGPAQLGQDEVVAG